MYNNILNELNVAYNVLHMDLSTQAQKFLVIVPGVDAQCFTYYEAEGFLDQFDLSFFNIDSVILVPQILTCFDLDSVFLLPQILTCFDLDSVFLLPQILTCFDLDIQTGLSILVCFLPIVILTTILLMAMPGEICPNC